MKFALFSVLLISGLAWSQTAASPGHPSRHASVGKKYGHAPAAAPNSNALASQLTKIEQGTHAPYSTAPRVSTAAAVPKTTPAQGKNKPVKYSDKQIGRASCRARVWIR